MRGAGSGAGAWGALGLAVTLGLVNAVEVPELVV